MNNIEEIYIYFGVDKYAASLDKQVDASKVEQLNRIITKYILSKAIEDVPREKLIIFDTIDFKNESMLVLFLSKHIPNFSKRLINYGNDFRRDFSTTGIVS
ncbi:MAG TPA: hypothetical protein PKJ26_01580 [Candidatus Woesebacteria bacterium]|nr:hypothetical protein [Candidatus Woesebacteria bacterium]HNS65167.1 hypothetical protein [Candidatus Woesebacteria bacterium]